MEIKMWIMGGGLTLTGVVLAFLIKMYFKLALERLDTIASELKDLNRSTIIHSETIKSLQEGHAVHGTRLNNHADRIRDLEIIVKPKVTTQQLAES